MCTLVCVYVYIGKNVCIYVCTGGKCVHVNAHTYACMYVSVGKCSKKRKVEKVA